MWRDKVECGETKLSPFGITGVDLAGPLLLNQHSASAQDTACWFAQSPEPCTLHLFSTPLQLHTWPASKGSLPKEELYIILSQVMVL